MKAFLGFCIYSYLLIIIGVWGCIWIWGDRVWIFTILLYGPRWIYLFPLVVLIPAALFFQYRWLLPLGLVLLIIVWPLMGFNIPNTKTDKQEGPRPAQHFRVLTYNIQRWSVSGESFSKLLDEIKPDFAAVQECAPGIWVLPPKWYVKRVGTTLVV